MTERKPFEIGKPEIRGDAVTKASGEERFSSDYFPEGLIWAAAVRAGVASGRLLKVDATAALTLPGVLKVLTSADVPGPNRHGIP